MERQWAEHAALKSVTGSEAQFDAEDLYAAIKVQSAWRGKRSRAKMLQQAEMAACAHHTHGAEATQALLVSLLDSAGLLPALPVDPYEEEGRRLPPLLLAPAGLLAGPDTRGSCRSPITRDHLASSVVQVAV